MMMTALRSRVWSPVSSSLRASRGGRRSIHALGASTFGKRLDALVEANEQVEVLKYTGDRGMDWSIADVKKHSFGFVAGLRDMFYKPGDRIACMLAPHEPELHCTQFAAAEAGYVVVVIDPKINDPAVLKKILVDNDVKMLIYGGKDQDVDIIGKVMPGWLDYDLRMAQPFYSQNVPTLKHIVTIGFDQHLGTQNYCHLMAQEATIEGIKPVSDDALLQIEYSKDGVKLAEYTHADMLKGPVIPAISAVLEKDFKVWTLGGPPPLNYDAL